MRTVSGRGTGHLTAYDGDASTFRVHAVRESSNICCVPTDSDVLLPARIVGPSLTVAGLAAWIFLHADRALDAERCSVLQDLIDSALRQGSPEVWIPRDVTTEAASLWEEAAFLAEGWAATAEPEKEAPEWRRHAERLRVRAESLRGLLQ